MRDTLINGPGSPCARSKVCRTLRVHAGRRRPVVRTVSLAPFSGGRIMDLLNALRGRTRRRAAQRRFPCQAVRTQRLVLEALEDRMLLSYSFALVADDGPHSPFAWFPP